LASAGTNAPGIGSITGAAMASAASTRASAHSSWGFPSCAKDISVTPWPTCQSQHTTVAAAMRQAFLQADAKTASVGRLNKRVKRRADVIGIFQNEASITPHKRRPCFSGKM